MRPLIALALMTAVSMSAQTTNGEKWSQSVLASQIFMAGTGGAHIAVSSAIQPPATKGQSLSYAGLLGTAIVLETTLLKQTNWKWKALVIGGNIAAGIFMVNRTHDNVIRARQRFGMATTH